MSAIIPTPRCPINILPATLAHLPFIDSLQKQHSKQVGWMPRKQLEGKIAKGQVIVAWAPRPCSEKDFCTGGAPVPPEEAVGYCIGHDQYFKRDDVGIIYQLNVVPGKQRALAGATLLKAQFDRSAWGCKLYCCWCAQDIEANHFWEACGFSPLAFRAGSESKRRVHIFWCKRIREGDTTTPWWFPSETKGGAMMEDRLVFPIPPGTHWSDAKPIVLPRHTRVSGIGDRVSGQKSLPGSIRTPKPEPRNPIVKRQPLGGGLMFQNPQPVKEEKPKRAKKAKIKNDPKFVSAVRELRDRWLERVNAGEFVPVLSGGKYEVTRALNKDEGGSILHPSSFILTSPRAHCGVIPIH